MALYRDNKYVLNILLSNITRFEGHSEKNSLHYIPTKYLAYTIHTRFC